MYIRTGNSKIIIPIMVKIEDVAAADNCLVSPPKSLKIIQLNEVACASALKPIIGSKL